MEQKSYYRYKARFYMLTRGRMFTSESEVYSGNIEDVTIPEDCLFIEIMTFESGVRQLRPQDAVNVDKYLVGNRFDRRRCMFTDDREKFAFTHNFVYKAHTRLPDRNIKNGKYCPEAQNSEESGS